MTELGPLMCSSNREALYCSSNTLAEVGDREVAMAFAVDEGSRNLVRSTC